MMNGHRKSDSSIVPKKLPNKDPEGTAEVMEGRELTKGNLLEQNALRTQGRGGVLSALDRVREAVRRKEGQGLVPTRSHPSSSAFPIPLLSKEGSMEIMVREADRTGDVFFLTEFQEIER